MQTLSRRLSWGLAAFFLTLLVTAVARWGVDVPYWDQWVLVHHLVSWHEGALSFGDLWRPHNEHRLLIPQSLMLALAWGTGWDIRFELWLNVALALATWLVALRLVNRCAGRLPPEWVVISSASMFGLAQWQNWSWGWQIQIFLNVLAVTAGFLCLAGESRWRVPLAGLCGVVASFSFGAGLLFWPLALPLLWPEKDRRLLRLGAWILLSAVVIGLYLSGLPGGSAAGEQSPWGGESPLRWAKLFAGYVSVYLGGAVFSFHGRLALFSAPFLAGAWLLLAIHGAQQRDRWVEDARRCVPLLLWGGYAVGAAILTASGRLSMGLGQALSSRYVTLSQIFWLALAGLVAALATSDRRRQVGSLVLHSILLAGFVLGSLHGSREMQRQHGERAELRRQILAGEELDDAFLEVLYPDPAEVRRHLSRLQRIGQGVYRND